MPIRTFADSGVLIAAHRGEPADKEKALAILEDPERIFLTNAFLYLQTVPKAIYFKQESELAFYRVYFEDPSLEWCRDLQAIYGLAVRQAEQFGLGAMDALHIAAAHLLRADELITIERPDKAIHRSSLVRVVYLYSLSPLSPASGLGGSSLLGNAGGVNLRANRAWSPAC